MAAFAFSLGKALPAAGAIFFNAMTIPLRATQLLRAAALLTAFATLYCQIYCAIAFQLTSRMPMPIETSAAWAFGVVVPWLTCFELCKRRRELASASGSRAIILLLIFVASGFLSIVLELGLDQLLGNGPTRPLSLQIAAQLPLALLTGGMLIIGDFLRRHDIEDPQGKSGDVIAEVLAKADDIEWIEAAGNYVEVHGGDRVSLHRVTMRDLERSLDHGRFTRIHRSVIVNAAQVDRRVTLGGAPGVRLRSGKTFKLGSRYSSAFEA